MTQSLNGGWTLTCLPEPAGKNPPFGVMPEMDPDLPTYLTVVPGEVQLTLQADGTLPDPFYADHYYRYMDYENCGWMYEKTFLCEAFPQGSRVRLTFGGVDTVADVLGRGLVTEVGSVEHRMGREVGVPLDIGQQSSRLRRLEGQRTIAAHHIEHAGASGLEPPRPAADGG